MKEMSPKNITTIFLEAQNMHLTKDVGQIAYCLHKKFGYDATLVTHRNSPNYPYIDNEVKGLNLVILEDRRELFIFKTVVLKYIFKNAKKIDILHLFHFAPANFFYFLLYKALNPAGLAYLKLDHDPKNFNGFLEKYRGNPLTAPLAKLFLMFAAKITDVFSCETREGIVSIRQKHPEFAAKLYYIPVGMAVGNANSIPRKNFAQKENIILAVGRIGLKQKNNEMLLDAAVSLSLGDWKIEIIGPLEESFKRYAAAFFEKHPQLKAKIHIRGEIADRKELYSHYNKAKIFCCTSRWDSGPIVLVEALYFGNYIVTTKVGAAEEIIQGGNIGTIVPQEDPAALAAALQAIIDNQDLMRQKYEDIIKHSQNFTFDVIAEQLQRTFTKK